MKTSKLLIKSIVVALAFFILPLPMPGHAEPPGGERAVAEATNLRNREAKNVEVAKSRVETAEADCAMARSASAGARRSGNAQAETIAREAEAVAEDELRLARQLIQKAAARLAESEQALAAARRGTAAPCSDIEAQLERDKEAIKRYEKTLAMSAEEMEKWAEKNKKAEQEALKSAAGALFGSVSKELLENKKIADHILRRFIDYQVQVELNGAPKQKVLVDQLIKKMGGASYAYAMASAKADTGKVVETGVNLKTYYDMAKASVDSVKSAAAVGDKEMAEVLQMVKDPENDLRANVSDLVSLTAEKGLEKVLEKTPYLNNLASFSLFVRDYSYNGIAWYQSRERILQNEKIADEQLKAVAALQKQITKTMSRLKECREDTRTNGH